MEFTPSLSTLVEAYSITFEIREPDTTHPGTSSAAQPSLWRRCQLLKTAATFECIRSVSAADYAAYEAASSNGDSDLGLGSDSVRLVWHSPVKRRVVDNANDGSTTGVRTPEAMGASLRATSRGGIRRSHSSDGRPREASLS